MHFGGLYGAAAQIFSGAMLLELASRLRRQIVMLDWVMCSGDTPRESVSSVCFYNKCAKNREPIAMRLPAGDAFDAVAVAAAAAAGLPASDRHGCV